MPQSEDTLRLVNQEAGLDKRRWLLNLRGFLGTAKATLLNLYYYSSAARDQLRSSIFDLLVGRLWIPSQVEFEYLKNREATLLKPISEKYVKQVEDDYLKNSRALVQKLQSVIENLGQQTRKTERHPYIEENITQQLLNDVTEYAGKFNAANLALIQEVNDRKKEIESSKESDEVLDLIEQYFSVGRPWTFQQQLDVIPQGQLRYSNKIPPGYKDQEEKIGTQKFGDLFVWLQIIEFASTSRSNIILVTDDAKEDWCLKDNKGILAKPRKELVTEFNSTTEKSFWMYSSEQFIFKCKTLLGSQIDRQVLDEIESVLEEKAVEKAYSLGERAKIAIKKWLISVYGGAKVRSLHHILPYSFMAMKNGQKHFFRGKTFVTTSRSPTNLLSFIQTYESSCQIIDAVQTTFVIVLANDEIVAMAKETIIKSSLTISMRIILATLDLHGDLSVKDVISSGH